MKKLKIWSMYVKEQKIRIALSKLKKMNKIKVSLDSKKIAMAIALDSMLSVNSNGNPNFKKNNYIKLYPLIKSGAIKK